MPRTSSRPPETISSLPCLRPAGFPRSLPPALNQHTPLPYVKCPHPSGLPSSAEHKLRSSAVLQARVIREGLMGISQRPGTVESDLSLENCTLARVLAERMRENRDDLTLRWLDRIGARVGLDPNKIFSTDGR